MGRRNTEMELSMALIHFGFMLNSAIRQLHSQEKPTLSLGELQMKISFQMLLHCRILMLRLILFVLLLTRKLIKNLKENEDPQQK